MKKVFLTEDREDRTILNEGLSTRKLPVCGSGRISRKNPSAGKTRRSAAAAAAVVLLIAVILSAAGCSDSEIPNGYIEISSSSTPYRIYVPKSWYNNSSGGQISAYYSAQDKSNIGMTAMIQDYDRGLVTVDDYVAAADGSLSALLPAYSRDGDFTDALLGGLEAKSFEYRATVDGTDYRFRQVVALKGYDFYIFTYTAEADRFESHLEEVDAILSYISFK